MPHPRPENDRSGVRRKPYLQQLVRFVRVAADELVEQALQVGGRAARDADVRQVGLVERREDRHGEDLRRRR